MIQVTIALKKCLGALSPGYALTYAATDNKGNSIGTFSNGTLTDGTGAASVSYSAGNTTYQGTFKITVSLKQNPSIKSSIKVLID